MLYYTAFISAAFLWVLTYETGLFTPNINQMKKIILISAFACSTLFLSAQEIIPKDTTVHNLKTVEITDSTNKIVHLYEPMSVVKLREVELKRGTGLFLDDAINANVPGVMMERRTISAGQQFNIRGYGNGARGTNGVNSNFDGQGYKVYLNGIPVTDAEGITLMDDIDFGSIANVDVVKGPAGTLYGLAIAGAVNLKTVTAEKNKVSIQQDALVGSYNLQRYTTHLAIGGERSSFLVNYGNQYYGGFMDHTSSHKDFVNVMGEMNPNEKSTITTYMGYSNSYDQRNGELTVKQYDTFDYSGNPSYIKNDAHSNVISFRAGVGHTYRFNKHISNTTSVFGSGINSNVSSAGGWTDKDPINYGVRSSFDVNLSLGEKFTLKGTTGAELQRQDAQIIGYNMVADSTNLTGYNIIGSMRSNQVTISKTNNIFTEWTLQMPMDISFVAGIGVSAMDITLKDRFFVASNNKPKGGKPTEYHAAYNNMVSPHFALNKVFSKKISVYASYSVGYKAPVSSYFFIPVTGEVVRGLKPETGTQYEVGTKGSLMKNKLHYELAIFDAIFSNKMTTIAVPNVTNTATSYTYVANGGRQNNMGAEALVKYALVESEEGFIKGLTPFVNACYSDFKYEDFKFQKLDASKKNIIEVDYSGNTVAGVPRFTFNAGVDLETKIGIYANVNYSYRDGVYYTSDEINKTASYNLVNAKLGFKKTLFNRLTLDVFGGANNITGTQYYYMVFLNQLPDAYLPAPHEINYFGGLNLKYTF
jgi:iron complex outermembrane receptor protein